MLIRCRFLKDRKPSGRDYTYCTSEKFKVGDVVQISSSAKGIVTEVDVPEEEVAAFADKVKSIAGRVKVVEQMVAGESEE